VRILIAEDDFSSRIALAGVLKKSGYEVMEVVNGAAAWDALQQPEAPRLVILDWMMPEMDGLEVLRRVRALNTDRLSYIILLTAKDEKADLVTGLDAGANDYLVKPFNVGELCARVEVGRRLIEMQDSLAAKIEDLFKSEEKHRVLLEKSSDSIFSCTPTGQCEYVNPAFAQVIGKSSEDIIGKSIWDVFSKDEASKYFTSIGHVFNTGEERVFEVCLQSTDGERHFLSTVTAIIDVTGKVGSVLCSSKDITERKRKEAYQEMGREVLQVLNDTGSIEDSIQRVLNILKMRTGLDAVGIRLQDGNDFPYFVQKGFSQDFYLHEDSLLERAADGGVCRDQNGNVRLECTCGLVISGKTDSINPFFTLGGSFWTNNSFPILYIPPSEDLRIHPRNRCIRYGYASFALIPIRKKERIVGLLQFNDKRQGCFTLDVIEILEGIASHLGSALMRKQSEYALQAERKRLEDIIGFLPDATLAVDKEGRIIIWNQAMESMTGLPAGEMINKGNYAYAIPFYGEARRQLIDLIFEDNEEIESRYPYINREGDTLTAEVYCKKLYNNEGAWVFAKASPLRDQSGNIIGAIESIRDITLNKQSEEKLRKNVAWFKALFNATSDSVILVNANGMILDLNEQAGYRRNINIETMRGQSLFDFLPSEAASRRHRAIDQILHERRLVQYDETHSDRHYRIRLFPVMDDQGKVIQVASFSRDITESRLVEEEKKKLQAQLTQAQKMEAIGTLAGGIAHDFNNILGAILGYAEIARDAGPSKPIVIKGLDKVIEAGGRAAALVKQILTFSRQSDNERVRLDPAFIIKEAIKLLRSSLPSTIAIKSQKVTATRPIFANPIQVHQILMNLCTNSFHAMEQTGGTVEVVLRDCAITLEELPNQPEIQPGNFVELTISDSGSGIDPEIRKRIFDPYFTTKELGKGTGLGLSIVHGIVASYGGFITCESEQGVGTSFHVFFPALKQEILPEIKPVEKIPLGNERILLVDDEEILAELGKTMLERLGYQVTVQTSSLEALAIFQNQPDRFEAIITDQTMPNLTGSDLARKILQIRPGFPIILCTGYSSLISEEKAKSLGIKGYVLKPVTKRTISKLLRDVIDENKLGAAVQPC